MSGYKLHYCNSEVKLLHEVEKWKGEFKNAKAVAWYFDAIVFYNIENGKWSKPLRDNLEEELVRLRVFDEYKEMHIWRSNGELKGRLRTDADGNTIGYVKGNQFLNGTSFDKTETEIIAKEDKGTYYELPYPDFKNIKSDGRLVLVTRNYIGYNDIGQAGYIDSRFVDFEIFKKVI